MLAFVLTVWTPPSCFLSFLHSLEADRVVSWRVGARSASLSPAQLTPQQVEEEATPSGSCLPASLQPGEQHLRPTYLPGARCACSKKPPASSCEEGEGSSAGTLKQERIPPELGGERTESCSSFLASASWTDSKETTCRQSGLCWAEISKLDWLVAVEECLRLAHLEPGEL